MGLRHVVTCAAALVASLAISGAVGATAGSGGSVLYTSASSDGSGCGPLMLVDADGSAESALGRNSCWGLASYSPDGTKLAYYDAETGEIAVADANGANRVLIADELPSALVWAGNNALVWENDAAEPVVESANIDGSGHTVVCGGGRRDFCGQPTVNPDGTRIAAVFDGDVWTYALDGSSPLQLTNDHLAFEPLWSPDGTRIAYSHFDFGPRPGTGSGSVDLWLMNRDGTSQHELVGPCSCFAAKWSHDSSFILYGLADENDVGVAIDRVDADGTGNRTLIGTDGGASTSFAVGLAPGSLGLSTDDGTIFFAHTHTGGPCCDAHVYSASAVDGSGLMQLTHEHGYALDLVSGSTGAAAESLGTPPPTPGLVLGPQKVSNVKLAGGDLLEVGFDLSVKGTKAPTTVTVSGVSATFDVTCTKTQKPGMIVVPIPDTTSTLPAKSAAWYPSGDAGDDATYQGQVTVPDTLCGPGGSINLRLGGTFAASVTSPDHGKSGIPVKVRWHYRAGSSGGKWSKAASIVPS